MNLQLQANRSVANLCSFQWSGNPLARLALFLVAGHLAFSAATLAEGANASPKIGISPVILDFDLPSDADTDERLELEGTWESTAKATAEAWLKVALQNYGDGYVWAKGTPGSHSATFRPGLEPGRYEVRITYNSQPWRQTLAYLISYRDGNATKLIDQNEPRKTGNTFLKTIPGGQPAVGDPSSESLGVYDFDETGFVQVSFIPQVTKWPGPGIVDSVQFWIQETNGSIDYFIPEDGNFTIDLDATDADGDELTWSLGEAPANGTAELNATTGFLTYIPNPDYHGTDSLAAVVSDGNSSDSITINLTIANVNDPGAVSVSGTLEQRKTLRAGVSDADGASGPISYQWKRDGVDVDGAISSTHLLTQDDVGRNLSVSVSYLDDNGTSENFTSAAVGPIANLNDAPVMEFGHVILDFDLSSDADADERLELQGTWESTASAPFSPWSYPYLQNYGDGYVWAKGSPGSHSATFRPGLEPGRYEVRITYNTTAWRQTLAYLVSHWDGNATKLIDQREPSKTGKTIRKSIPGGQPAEGDPSSESLGVYDFDEAGFVQVSFIPQVTRWPGPGTVDSVQFWVRQSNGSVDYSMSEDTSFTIDLNATDADGDAIAWSLGEGPAHGTAEINPATGFLTYMPNPDYHGSDSVVVDVTDGTLTDSVTINLTIANVPDASVIAQGDGPLDHVMLEDGNFTIDLDATDADGDALSWSLSSAPANGTAELNASTGLLTYLPNLDYHGSDSLTAIVSDGNLSDSFTINFAIASVNDAGVTFISGTPTEREVLTANVFDVEGVSGPITYQWRRDGVDIDGATDANYLLTQGDVGRSLSVSVGYLDALGTTENPISTRVGSIAKLNETPVIQFADVVLDDDQAELQGEWFSGSWWKPHLGAGYLYGADWGGAVSGTYRANLKPGRYEVRLSYSPSEARAADVPVTVIHKDGQANFAVDQTQPPIDGETVGLGVFDFDENGFVIVSTEGAGGVVSLDSVQFLIDENNASVHYFTTEDNDFIIDLNATDADYDVLTWGLSAGPIYGTAFVNAVNGLLTYRPNPDFRGSDSLTVSVTDGTASDSVTINLTVAGVNDAPVITQGDGPFGYSLTMDSDFAIDLDAIDVDFDSLSWSLGAAPAKGTAVIKASTGVMAYRPNPGYSGSDSITVSVTDGLLSDSVTFDFTIADPNVAPLIPSTDGPLGYSMPNNGDFTINLTIAHLNGTAEVNATNGPLTFRSHPDYSGSESLTTIIADGNSSDSVTINLTIGDSNGTRGGSVLSALSGSVGVTDLGQGWRLISWLGAFYDSGEGWVFHEKHGWLFVHASNDDNFWLYDVNLGWLWTGSNYYGTSGGRNFVYSNSEQSWLNFMPTDDGKRWFYFYSEGCWKSVCCKSKVSVTTSVSPIGGGIVSGAGTHSSGDVVEFTATPNSGYRFIGWSEDASGTSPTLSLTVTEAKKVQANFVRLSASEIINALFK